MSENNRGTFGYDEIHPKRPFKLPPECLLVVTPEEYELLKFYERLPEQYILLSARAQSRLFCEEGLGLQVLTSPQGLPVVKRAANVAEDEVCWVVR